MQLWDDTNPSYIRHDHRDGKCIEETFEWKQYLRGCWKFSDDWDMFFEKRPTCIRSHAEKYIVYAAKYYRGSSVKGYAANQYERRERQNKRNTLRNATREYNAHGETDISLPPYRHRHGALWDLW